MRVRICIFVIVTVCHRRPWQFVRSDAGSENQIRVGASDQRGQANRQTDPELVLDNIDSGGRQALVAIESNGNPNPIQAYAFAGTRAKLLQKDHGSCN